MEWHNLAGKEEHAHIQAFLKKFVPEDPVSPRNPKAKSSTSGALFQQATALSVNTR